MNSSAILTDQEKVMRNIRAYPKYRVESFKQIPTNRQGFYFLTLSREAREQILSTLDTKEIAQFLEFLDPDQVTNALKTLPQKRKEKIIQILNSDLHEKVMFLLRFNPQTAASIMDLNYVQVNKKSRFKKIAGLIDVHQKRTGKIPAVLAVENGLLLGEVPLSKLILEKSDTSIDSHIKPLPTVRYTEPTEEVLKLFTRYPHSKIVVLDNNNSILGIIYSDDILPLIQKKTSAHLYRFAGVKQEEDVFDPPLVKVHHRYKWLIVNLGTAYLAAGVVSMFAETISKFVLLAAYMPIVAGMGGNTGTQTLAVMVRGIALGEIELKNSWRAIFNEMASGFMNGLINGAIVAVVALLWNQSALFGVITAFAMIISLTVAGFAGALIPLILKKLGKDPATSATIFITTVTDVCGFFTFLGLASLLL